MTAEIRDRLRSAIVPGQTIGTIVEGRPNSIAAIDEKGIWIETERSRARGAPSQLVPWWMIEIAWNDLQQNRTLTNARLLNELNEKRSSAVCALLAQLNDVDVASTRPLTLRLG